MAKGDSVRISIATPTSNYTETLIASKAGRKVKVTNVTKAKAAWVVATEINRNGKPTGGSIEVPRAVILSMRIQQDEEV